jgi:hypothetical protein
VELQMPFFCQIFKCQKMLQIIYPPILSLIFVWHFYDQNGLSEHFKIIFFSVSEGRVLLELTHRCAGEGEKVSWVPTGTVSSSQKWGTGNCQCSGSGAAGSAGLRIRIHFIRIWIKHFVG